MTGPCPALNSVLPSSCWQTSRCRARGFAFASSTPPGPSRACVKLRFRSSRRAAGGLFQSERFFCFVCLGTASSIWICSTYRQLLGVFQLDGAVLICVILPGVLTWAAHLRSVLSAGWANKGDADNAMGSAKERKHLLSLRISLSNLFISQAHYANIY